MFIEPTAPKELLRSSGEIFLRFDNILRSYGALAMLAVIGYKHLALCDQGQVL